MPYCRICRAFAFGDHLDLPWHARKVAELRHGSGCAPGKAAAVGTTSKAPSVCSDSGRSVAVSCPVDCAAGEAL
eukprot:11157992-Lingulodinium_polyedra.AAC.1